jgi:hypothetical protein
VDGATALLIVVFSPEACSFYDFIRGNNDILAMGNCAILAWNSAYQHFSLHLIRGTAIAT